MENAGSRSADSPPLCPYPQNRQGLVRVGIHEPLIARWGSSTLHLAVSAARSKAKMMTLGVAPRAGHCRAIAKWSSGTSSLSTPDAMSAADPASAKQERGRSPHYAKTWLRYSSRRAGKGSPTRNLILWKQPWERGQGPERLRPRRDGRAGTFFAFAIDAFPSSGATIAAHGRSH